MRTQLMTYKDKKENKEQIKASVFEAIKSLYLIHSKDSCWVKPSAVDHRVQIKGLTNRCNLGTLACSYCATGDFFTLKVTMGKRICNNERCVNPSHSTRFSSPDCLPYLDNFYEAVCNLDDGDKKSINDSADAILSIEDLNNHRVFKAADGKSYILICKAMYKVSDDHLIVEVVFEDMQNGLTYVEPYTEWVNRVSISA